MTEKVLAEITDYGLITTAGHLDTTEAEQLLQILPNLILEARKRYRVKLQLAIEKAEERVIELRKELEALP